MSGWRRARPSLGVRGTGGQATVELALVLPLLVLLALAIVQTAVVVRDQILTVHAAREAARSASVDPDPARATREAQAVLPGVQVDVGPRAGIGRPIVVDATYRVPTRVPVIGAFVRDVRLRARAVMLAER